MLFCIDFFGILAPSWPPTWGHLGSQDGSKSEKMAPKNFWGASLFRVLVRTCFWRPFKSLLASILGGSGLDFRWFLDDFLSFLAYFGHVFACSFLPWFSVFLVRSSANFAKKIQELAEDKAENPRTCRGQSREKNPYERLQENSNHQSFLLLNSLPYRNPPYSKNLGRRYSPQGGFNINRFLLFF